MIRTSIHGITQLTIGEPTKKMDGSVPYYVRTLVAQTKQGEQCKIDLFSDTPEELGGTQSSTEAEYWRTHASEESARADAAENLANKWMNKHAVLYVTSEKDRQRADSAESRLAALRDLLHKACGAAGERQ